MLLNAKRYALVLIAICFTAFRRGRGGQCLIDPQRVFGTNLFPDKLNENLRFRQYLAYRNAEDRIGGLMFASSRGGGIPLDVLSAQTGVTFANFTVAAGLITDHLPVLERAIADKAARGERPQAGVSAARHRPVRRAAEHQPQPADAASSRSDRRGSGAVLDPLSDGHSVSCLA